MVEYDFKSTPIQLIEEKENHLYIKRDDLIPFSFGGNKVRISYEYIKDLKENNYTCMVAYGNSRSNLCRAIANICNIYQIDCYVISPIEDGEKYIRTNNSIIVEQLVKEIIPCKKSEVPKVIEETLNKLRKKGENPYYIYDNDKVQAALQAYIKAYKEIKDYEQDNKMKFDYIFLASGTGTTQSGLICGQILNKDENRRIVGISIARNKERGKKIIEDNLKLYFKKNYVQEALGYDFIDEYVLDGYGKYNEEICNTIKDMMLKKGVPLDSTYTGKAYWGMKQFIQKKGIKGRNILFIHTGGTPLFFDNIEQLLK